MSRNPCNEPKSKGDEGNALATYTKTEKVSGSGTVTLAARPSFQSHESLMPSVEELQKWHDVKSPAITASKKDTEMLKYQVKNGSKGKNDQESDVEETAEKDGNLESSGFEFGFENQPPKAEFDELLSDDSFHRAASITSSCVDSLENAEILTAEEIKCTKISVKDAALLERTLILPDIDELLQPLIPKEPKFFSTEDRGKEEAQRLLRSLGRVPSHVHDKENVPGKGNDAVTESDTLARPKSPRFDARSVPPNKPALKQTKVTLLPPMPFYPPSPTRPPPPPPKDSPPKPILTSPPGKGGFKTMYIPYDDTQFLNPPPKGRYPPPNPNSPSRKYKELNLRPPIPISPLQSSMYGSTSTLPLPKTPSPTAEKKLPNFSRRQTLFGNRLTVPSPADQNLRRASYNSPSTRSVRLPPSSPGMPLPPRPETACGMDRAGSSASVRSSKRERIKNFFKKH